MIRLRTMHWFSLCVLCALCCELLSAPPTLTSHFPAGGQRGSTIDVTAGGAVDPWPSKVWVSDPALKVEPGKAKGTLRVAIAADAKPGVHYLRLFNDHGPSGLRPFVVGTLPEIVEKEPNDLPAKPQEIKGTSVVVNGRLDKTADVDVFAVNLKQGQTLVASLDANRTFKSPMDAVLQVVSPDGFLETENHDSAGLDPQVAFTAPKDGTYCVRIFAFPAVPNSSISISSAETYIYRLTLTTAGFADFPLPLAVSRAKPGTVKLQGWNIPSEATTLELESTNDVAVARHAKLANAIPVRFESLPVIDAVSAPDAVKSPLEPPFAVTGRVEKPGGAFAVRVNVKKPQPLQIQVDNLQSQGLPMMPLIRVLDTTGTQVSRGEPGRPGDDAKLALKTPADGTYTIEVRDLFNDGGPRHVFLLRVGAVPDFTLTCPTDRIYVVPGKPLELKLAIARVGGFKSEVVVKAVDLPDGLKMEIVPPAGKADPAAVTLRFSAEKAAIGGAIQLVGTSKDDPAMTRLAKANDADLGETTANLWIVATDTPKPGPVPKKKR